MSESFDEPSVEGLSASVAQLRSQLSEIHEKMRLRDEVAASTLAQLHEPQTIDYPEPAEIVARTPRPRQPLPNTSVAPQESLALTRQALAFAAANEPTWNEHSSEVMKELEANPGRFGSLIQSRDPQGAGAHLAALAMAQQQRSETRSMKLAAQSAVGASGRSKAPPENEWDDVMKFAKGQRNYWD